MQSVVVRTVVLTAFAIIAFAANSVLARLALAGGGIDVLGFTGLRMVSGAVILMIAGVLTARGTLWSIVRSGSWWQAASLLAYAITASLSYALLGAGVGALILFGTVQIATIGRAIVLGERPGKLVWLGLAMALGALVYLISPSLVPPDPVGVALSVVSGLSWAAYSLSGHRSNSPLRDTAGNFLRIAPISLILSAVGLAARPATLDAAFVALLCGAVSTGIGYAIWYAVLPSLKRVQASIVQLIVPVVASLSAIPLLGEPLTARFAISAVATIGGVGLAILARHVVRRSA